MHRLRSLLVAFALLVWLVPATAFAYVGPGGGVSLVGSVLAVVVAIVAALLGFVWYPIKRLLRKMRGTGANEDDKAK